MLSRPHFNSIKTGAEFSKWYWLKSEMAAICKGLSLSQTGSKFELRDRILNYFDGEDLPKENIEKPLSNFDWVKGELSSDTIITDNISFGPNFRNFMKTQVGNKFVCHSDFMVWVKSHIGLTLSDAALAWYDLDKRKANPAFKRDIAKHNMLAQYVRDFLADNNGATLKNALAAWKVKSRQIVVNGYVKYESADIKLAHNDCI